jgi:Lon-like ATP-dependent protease
MKKFTKKAQDFLDFKTTEDIKIPSTIHEQVIGQESAVEVIQKAARQLRHVLLIGEPGTGKSMVGQALAELLQPGKIQDIICVPNPKDENTPLIAVVPAGQGRKIVEQSKLAALSADGSGGWMFMIVIFAAFFIGSTVLDWIVTKETSEVLKAADRISGTMMIILVFISAMMFFALLKFGKGRLKAPGPKLLVDNSERKIAPFIDATGLHEGALLGDVQHDPFQTGGLGTPAHERVSAGAIHNANGGVLFIDEIATLKPEMQVEILTAMQEKRYPITGRSERSAGAMVKTKPVPTDFILVAAGNLDTISRMNPALRSRIRGNGYEVYMKDKMPDTPENVRKMAIFVAQEISKDKKIPPFTKAAVMEIINEARRRAGRKGYLSLKLRDLGGLIRVAGDVASGEKAKYVDVGHITKAKEYAATLEQQLAHRYTVDKKEYQVIKTVGKAVGRVNGLAVIGGETGSGIILPIEAAVVPALSKERGNIIATGKLGEIAKEAITNVSALIKKYSGRSLGGYDIHIQFLQTFEGVEGDSASISVATAVISAIEKVPVKQDVAMTGSLSIRGEVLPIGGINSKLEAAKEAGIKTMILPKSNMKDVLVDTSGMKLIAAEDIAHVLEYALDWSGKKHVLHRIKRAL